MLTHVLVLEDDREISEVICEHLAEHGYRCTTAASAEEARMMLRLFTIDLVIADVTLPGRETGTVIAREARDRGIPAMIVTGYAWTEDADLPVLRKPLRLTALREMVERLLRQRASSLAG